MQHATGFRATPHSQISPSLPTDPPIFLQLVRPGGIIAVDNAIRGGKVVSDEFQDEATVATRKVNDFCAVDPRVDSTLFNMADGVLIAIKK